MPRSVPERVENAALICGDGWGEGLGGAVDRDGGAAQGPQLFDDLGDGQAGAGLDGVGDGQGGEHDGQVRFDGIASVVEDMMRAVRLSRISTNRSRSAGSGRIRGQRRQACSWMHGVVSAGPQVPRASLRCWKWPDTKIR